MKVNILNVYCFIFAITRFCYVTAAQTPLANNDCETVRLRFSRGTCSGTGIPCRNACTGVLIQGRNNCTSASECCYFNGVCTLRLVDFASSQSISRQTSLNQGSRNERDQFISLLRAGSNVRNRNDTGRRGLSSSGTHCPVFPFNCPLPDPLPSEPAIVESQINIPYCQRTPCFSEILQLDNIEDFCLKQPGCYFDRELFTYRRLVGQALLPGVPVCYAAIKNKAFLARARQAGDQLRGWNPILTQCILDMFESEIFGDVIGCQLIKTFEYFGHKPKLAGWSGISRRDCILIGGCWKKTYCAYPFRGDGNPIISSSNDEINALNFNSSYGLPRCLPLHSSQNNEQFLSAYHTCLASGCSTSVSSQAINGRLEQFGSSLPYPLNFDYLNMVRSGKIRPDNFLEILNELRQRPINLKLRNIPLPLSNLARLGHIQVFPFAVQLNSNISRNFFTNYNGNFNRVGIGAFSMPSRNQQIISQNKFPSRPINQTNSQGYFHRQLFSSIFSTPIHSFCPFNNDATHFGLPSLSGNFVGCCQKNLCYIPKQVLHLTYSGISPYLTHWTFWVECNATCGGGLQTRSRMCIKSHFKKGVENVDCSSAKHKVEFRACNTQLCPSYEEWASWNVCSKSCGGGTTTRTRRCTDPGHCSGRGSEAKPCRTGACPTFQFGEWGACSRSCGQGIQTRVKICTNGGGFECPQPDNEERVCSSYCGSWRESCNPVTCCTVRSCFQANGVPGYCLRTNYRSRYCWIGNCINRWPRQTLCDHQSQPFSFTSRN